MSDVFLWGVVERIRLAGCDTIPVIHDRAADGNSDWLHLSMDAYKYCTQVSGMGTLM